MPELSSLASNCMQAGSIKSSKIALQLILQNSVYQKEQEHVFSLVERAWHPALQLASLLWLIKNELMLQELSSLLDFDIASLQEIKSITPLEAYFPAIGNDKAVSLRRVIYYHLPDTEFKTVCLRGAGTESFSHLAKLSGKSGIIAFDAPIDGNSWQMAAMALMKSKKKLNEKYAFTGIVMANGEIRSAESLIKKKAFCKKRGMRLISRLTHVSQLESWLNEELIPLPLLNYFGGEKEQLRCLESMEKCIQESMPWFSLAALEDFFGIPSRDLILGNAEPLPFEPELWQEFLCKTSKSTIEALRDKLGSRGIIWFLAGQISSLQFGMGSIIGFKQGLSILQLDFTSSKYKKVISLFGNKNARELKNVSQHIEGFKKIKVKFELNNPESQNLSMILYFGSHNPIGEAKAYSQRYLDVDNFLIVEALETQGVMSLEEDWLEWVQEINSALNELRGNYHWQKIHLFQTAPTALCLALGVAFGHFMPIKVYHYQFDAPQPKYKSMYTLDTCLP